MIRYESAGFTYPDAPAPALRDVDLSVDDGELLLIAGPSGAGKSTLLRMANGLVPHYAGGTMTGRVLAGGRDTRACKPRDLADVVGYVPQDPEGSSVAATVEDEIAFVLENLGVEPALMRKRVEETLDALSIASLRDRRLDTLSGGERQRVAIAGVLAASPAMLVLDEPTSQLDPQSAEEVLQATLRLSHELGLGVMLAEHRLERVAGFADRVCIVEAAAVRAGEPRTMLASYAGAPPVTRLARALKPRSKKVPLTVREARRAFRDQPLFFDGRSSKNRGSAGGSHAVAPGDVAVSVRGLRVALGGRVVCDVERLDVRAGETLVVAGRNGAGKTTLLRAIAGVARRARGEVIAGGGPIGYVPQNATRMLALATARREIAATLKLNGRDPKDADRVLGEWRLSPFAERDPRDLSGGEATRLAVAAACAAEPRVVLLDEPTRGVDHESKEWLAALLGRWRAQGRAVVVVTHDVELIAQIATRVALMSDGRVVVDGPVREVLGESVMFSTQMNKVFGDRRISTVDDAAGALT